VCLLTAHRLSCDYQWKQHVQIAKATGVPAAKIDAIKADQITGEGFSEIEKALLAFLDEVLKGPRLVIWFSKRLGSISVIRLW
jgi:alkylhydroperoxidase family enzyme